MNRRKKTDGNIRFADRFLRWLGMPEILLVLGMILMPGIVLMPGSVSAFPGLALHVMAAEEVQVTDNGDTITVTAPTEADAAKAVRENFLGKTDSRNYQNDRFTYTYQIYISRESAEYSDKEEGAKAIASKIRAYTGAPMEGDYLKYNLSCTVNPALNRSGVYGYQMNLGWLYTSGALEQQMTEAISEFQKEYIRSGMTDYQKFRTIYQYICDHVSYAYETSGEFVDYLMYTPYSALVNQKATCSGYSCLLYRLCLENGIACRVIDGAGHARNIVQMDGAWYVCDSTWDAGKNLDTYRYFLVGKSSAQDMISSDNTTTADVFSRYELSETAYVRPADPEADAEESGTKEPDTKETDTEETDTEDSKTSNTVQNNYKPCRVTWRALDRMRGKTGVRLSWKKLKKVTGYQIFRKSGTGSYKKLKTCSASSSCSYKDKSVKKGKTYRYKIRAYYKKGGKIYYGTFSVMKKVKEC